MWLVSDIKRSSLCNPLPECFRSKRAIMDFNGNFLTKCGKTYQSHCPCFFCRWDILVNVHLKFYFCLILAEPHNNCSFQGPIIAEQTSYNIWLHIRPDFTIPLGGKPIFFLFSYLYIMMKLWWVRGVQNSYQHLVLYFKTEKKNKSQTVQYWVQSKITKQM